MLFIIKKKLYLCKLELLNIKLEKMKKLMSILTVAVVCNALIYSSFAQKTPFAGTVKFEQKYEGNINPQKHIPIEATYTIFENKTKVTLFMGVNVFIIQDGDALVRTVLIDIPQGRIGLTDSKEEVDEELLMKKFTYAERDDTKTICGYECKGYDVTCIVMSDDDDDEDEATEIKTIVYTTQEIGKDNNINAFDYPGLSGFPLYTETEADGVKTIVQAKEVKKSKVKATDFLIPSDYKMLEGEQKEGLKRNLGL